MSTNYYGPTYWAIPGYWVDGYWPEEVIIPQIGRSILFGINPETLQANSYVFEQLEDFNSLGAVSTCAYTPVAKGSQYSLLQEATYLGTLNAGGMFKILSNDTGLDGSEIVTGVCIIGRIDPESDVSGDTFGTPNKKRFVRMEFLDISPISSGLNVYCCVDEDPTKGDVTWNQLITGSDSLRYFENAIGRYIYLKFEDTTANFDVPVIGSFAITYYNLGML